MQGNAVLSQGMKLHVHYCTSVHLSFTSKNKTQKGSDLEATSRSRRFWQEMESSTLQTQYWEPTGAAEEVLNVYAMGFSKARQSEERTRHK